MKSISRTNGWYRLALLAPLLLGGGARPVGSAVAPRALDVVSNDGTYRLTVSYEPAEIPSNERFAVRFTLERADGEPSELEVEVDARMPGHGHGMNRDAILKELMEGRYEASNLLFHMPGYWEIYFDVTEGAVTERAQVSVELE